ncbi:MFS transporter [Kribbella deserti]|uniref:MFS transporter n=1 Tax=Kribbella deserti TaxID=1926257 RepID=A0ABV6QMM5_9ACTN
MYPLYQLLFADHGLSATQISTLFIIWSTTAFVLEVPSGAWADIFSRRRLLVLGALLTGAGYAAWVLFPSYGGFAAGFVLWGAGSALASGTFEAFAYDELAARGATERYAGLIGRATSASFVLNLAATALAAPLFASGGYLLVGWISVLVCVIQAFVALCLPEAEPVASADETEEVTANQANGVVGRYLAMLRSGLAEVATVRLVRHAVILVAIMSGFLAFDEYFPLLARDMGASTTIVPILIAITVAAQAIGSALAGPANRLRSGPIALGLAMAAGLIAIGSLSGSTAGFVPIALGYGGMQLVIVVADARLQDAITGPARATVTSVSGLFSEVFAVGIYAGFALGGLWFGMPVLVAALTVPVVITAFLLPRWLPARSEEVVSPDSS